MKKVKGTRRTYILAIRCLSWAPNTPKLLLRPGLCPGPRWGSLQRSPRPPSWIKGGLLLRGGEGREEEGGQGREGKEGERGQGRGGGWGGGGEGSPSLSCDRVGNPSFGGKFVPGGYFCGGITLRFYSPKPIFNGC